MHEAGGGEQPHGSTGFAVVVVGASAGGLAALEAALAPLPADVDVPVVVVRHVPRDHASHLGDILDRRVAVRVQEARDGDVPRPGTVHVAPAGHDLTLRTGGALAVSRCGGAQVTCPAIDRLFTSAAEVHGPATIAVVLSGTGGDGAQGVVAVSEAGGVVVAQADAAFDGMPRAAQDTGRVDLVVPAGDIGGALTRLLARGRAA